MTVAGAHKLPGPLAHKGTGDHPPDLEPGPIQLGAHQLTEGIEALQTKVLLVTGDLEHRIGRGVDNGRASADMLLPQPIQYLGARGVTVAQQAGQRRLRHHTIQQILGKTRYRLGEIVPVKEYRAARQLPVAGGSILARGDLASRAIGRHGGQPLNTGRKRACGYLGGMSQTKRSQMRNDQRAVTTLLSPPLSAAQGDMAQGIGPFVTKAGGIGSATHP